MKLKQENISQNWLPIESIYNNGIILYKNFFIKILKITPINYDLKSNLEKESILNSYKNFLKICDFDIQILIQSKKEDISKTISQLKNVDEKDIKINEIKEEYIKFIKKMNDEKKSSSKNFYIIIRKNIDILNGSTDEFANSESKVVEYLNDCYFKIKENLSKCGNTITEINNKIEVEKILNSFLK